ncbi:signal peptide protein [Cryptosporidium sp. chipmunk genotype I]|uniref:signal peptide protein n=1 Tax=Cryptosporidium sp. chipmunk genotype I TaxID=1280935 RepID=UPI00351A1BB7|nr:signal peptide protein [Cryptosporidium sp. chipmunk genotype I]
MKFKKGILCLFVYLSVILQICIHFKFVYANSTGKFGYYDYNESSNSDKKLSKRFRNGLGLIKENFMKFFLNNNQETESDTNTTQNYISKNTPFMDFLHVPLIKRIIPKSEEFCSSIQLMSFWKLYSDVIDLVESEFNYTIDLNLVSNKFSKQFHENNLVLTQSSEISQDISDELKRTKNDSLTINRASADKHRNIEASLRSQNNTIKINVKSNKVKNQLNKKKKKGKDSAKVSTFEFGLHRYFHLN